MGKKVILFLVLIFLQKHSFSQEESVIKTGLVRFQLTISPAKMLSSSNSYFYLHGNLEGYLNENYSLAGEGYFYQGMISKGKSEFNFNHSVFFGFSKHFTKGNFDYYIGIQPGFSFTDISSPYPYDNVVKATKMAVNPLFSSVTGINYYVGKFFHFFLQSRLVLGHHNTNAPQNLADLRFSAGLGFNLNTMK
ncbi:MAG: hypothetical protein V4622_01910 [Bacteroidota bacterium]